MNTDTIIADAIASATQSANQTAEPASPVETPENPVETSQPEQSEGAEQPEKDADKAAEPVETPEDIVRKKDRAIKNRERLLNKTKAELDFVKAELERMRNAQPQKQPEKKASDGPQEDDFDTYGEYLIARAKHELKQEQLVAEQAQRKTTEDQQYSAWVAQREEAIRGQMAESVQKHKDAIPDFATVIHDNADIADDFPQHVVEAFLHAKDAPMAFYNLAKEGRLEQLAQMHPYQVAAEIALAGIPKAAPVKKVTGAPTPLSAAKGTGEGQKSMENMSWKEIKKAYFSD